MRNELGKVGEMSIVVPKAPQSLQLKGTMRIGGTRCSFDDDHDDAFERAVAMTEELELGDEHIDCANFDELASDDEAPRTAHELKQSRVSKTKGDLKYGKRHGTVHLYSHGLRNVYSGSCHLVSLCRNKYNFPRTATYKFMFCATMGTFCPLVWRCPSEQGYAAGPFADCKCVQVPFAGRKCMRTIADCGCV
eukprot:gene13241-biopygen1982